MASIRRVLFISEALQLSPWWGLQLCGVGSCSGYSICCRAKEKEGICSFAHLAGMRKYVRSDRQVVSCLGAPALSCDCWLLLVGALD